MSEGQPYLKFFHLDDLFQADSCIGPKQAPVFIFLKLQRARVSVRVIVSERVRVREWVSDSESLVY